MRDIDMTEQAYRNGYADGLKDGKPKWIPVEERLPQQPDETVLVYVCCRWHEQPTLGNYDNGWELYFPLHQKERVIAWMPLPEPPEEATHGLE